MNAGLDTNALRSIYSKDPLAKTLCDKLSTRQRTPSYTSVSNVIAITGGDRSGAISLLKTLDSIGAGVFIVGRRGASSRLEWAYDARRLKAVAIEGEKATEINRKMVDILEDSEQIEEQNLQNPNNNISHEFTLRPDQKITILLPRDLSQREAARLASFIQTLPFDSE